MTLVLGSLIAFLGRCVFSVAALVGVGTLAVLLGGDNLTPVNLIFFISSVAGVSLTAVFALLLVSNSLQLVEVPSSWLACVGLGGFYLVFNGDLVFAAFDILGQLVDVSGSVLSLHVVRLFNTVVFAGSALGLMFCMILLVLELPFVICCNLPRARMRFDTKIFRPILLFLLVTFCLDLVVAFILDEWPLGVLYASN